MGLPDPLAERYTVQSMAEGSLPPFHREGEGGAPTGALTKIGMRKPIHTPLPTPDTLSLVLCCGLDSRREMGRTE